MESKYKIGDWFVAKCYGEICNCQVFSVFINAIDKDDVKIEYGVRYNKQSSTDTINEKDIIEIEKWEGDNYA